ncbi:calmodulin, putative [Perkinsus marinus ATCC 50983]|uniref:Calmodulin, putative n=1 Tax=Perkinsus marinus (strain ATCC 50983 / TXsc) TaxID=423536 RepID=C5L5P6_PERM5|nr:calmodulin, putative [Perkinsus marinus ATCC 50983]EER07943.1 calmodulin, putative [Perkinsus marinus ATCC 50983]|eukprot:XP_002776127.1 calmodulin, putative [Perkinsus marinus ATCC 50983]
MSTTPSPIQLERYRLVFAFLDEHKEGVLEVDNSLGHFIRLAGFCPSDEQLQKLIEKLQNEKVNYFDFSKAVEVLCDELLIGCNSTVMFDETLDALKLLGDGNGISNDVVSLSTLRSALISCGDDDERTAKNFDRMLRETGYKGKEEVDAYGFAEKLLGLVEIEK